MSTDRARSLRQSQTLAEAALWKLLRGGRLDGLKFRRQHPIGRYFADFACASARLVIELDGGVHDRDEAVTYDHLRQQEIEAAGWHVLRFRNDDVFGEPHKVVDEILRGARSAGRVTPHPPALSRGPLPLPPGEGYEKTHD
ncbi:endonuclease domain-containing protein [Caulobacter sp. 17J80-11]|uniref:endonuclease domain-containing protein n=1 Tax=Caulobacter sp. 17J80-11 TaxID=2763502 RepID=UPI001653514F|nr:DUF559 domain-containing protein [Caulobacter sp. 17J80-11]